MPIFADNSFELRISWYYISFDSPLRLYLPSHLSSFLRLLFVVLILRSNACLGLKSSSVLDGTDQYDN